MESKKFNEIASGNSQTTNKNEANNTNYPQSELNLKNKVTNVFSDLEFLKKSLKDIRGAKEDSKTIPNNYKTYDFFSDDRYRTVLDQIKQSNPNPVRTKQQKNPSSKDKSTGNSLLGLNKPTKENAKESNGESSN